MQDSQNSDKSQTKLVDIILALEQSEDQNAWHQAISRKLDIKAEDICELRLKKHSIDARQRQIKVQLRIEVGYGVIQKWDLFQIQYLFCQRNLFLLIQENL